MSDDNVISMREFLGKSTGKVAPDGFPQASLVIMLTGEEWCVMLSRLCGFVLSEQGDAVYRSMERKLAAQLETHLGNYIYTAYVEKCHEDGEVPCSDIEGHVWVTSDENENDCYCEKCGTREY